MDKELKTLLYLENLSYTTKQINQYINYVLKDIYKKYFSKKYETYDEFKKKIIQNDRPQFLDKKNIDE
jgi:hypothetical protein